LRNFDDPPMAETVEKGLALRVRCGTTTNSEQAGVVRSGRTTLRIPLEDAGSRRFRFQKWRRGRQKDTTAARFGWCFVPEAAGFCCYFMMAVRTSPGREIFETNRSWSLSHREPGRAWRAMTYWRAANHSWRGRRKGNGPWQLFGFQTLQWNWNARFSSLVTANCGPGASKKIRIFYHFQLSGQIR